MWTLIWPSMPEQDPPLSDTFYRSGPCHIFGVCRLVVPLLEFAAYRVCCFLVFLPIGFVAYGLPLTCRVSCLGVTFFFANVIYGTGYRYIPIQVVVGLLVANWY